MEYSVTLAPIHGNAKLVRLLPALPLQKKEIELFWTNKLFHKLKEFKSKHLHIFSNPDDSNRQSDVFVHFLK